MPLPSRPVACGHATPGFPSGPISRLRRPRRIPGSSTSSASSIAFMIWEIRWGSRHARECLLPGGCVMLVEPFALDSRPRNIAENPMAALFYVASSCVCTPNSLSQDVGLALGAQAGEAKLREVFREAGFNHFRRATQTPMNLVFEARI